MNKKLLPTFVILLFLVACTNEISTSASDTNNGNAEETGISQGIIRGIITIDTRYGTPQPNFTAKDMMARGFNYGDLVHVQIGDSINVVAPFVTAYSQVGIMGMSCCDYGAKGGTVDIGLANGNFHERIGGNDGDSIIMTMKEKEGYLKEYNLLQGAYDNIPDNYPSDSAFANFRKVTTTGMGDGRLYRGSNPLNADNNPVRFAYMDVFARSAGIRTEIDLADDDDMVMEQLVKRQDTCTYCPSLFRNGNVVCLKMGVDNFSDDFKAKLKRGLLFMIDHEPPYLIHCNEGKDRCGFVSLLLEILMGADITEIQEDYMVTFENYYKYPYRSETWVLNQTLNVDRMLKLLFYPNLLDDIANMDWNVQIDATPTMLYTKTVEYLKSAGLTDSDISKLKARLN